MVSRIIILLTGIQNGLVKASYSIHHSAGLEEISNHSAYLTLIWNIDRQFFVPMSIFPIHPRVPLFYSTETIREQDEIGLPPGATVGSPQLQATAKAVDTNPRDRLRREQLHRPGFQILSISNWIQTDRQRGRDRLTI